MFISDLHIHSRYSRATSKECTPEHLDLWSRRKGIDILGTGDFTHPAWREELKEKLEPAESGLYTLKKDFRLKDDTAGVKADPRFVITGEISSIYKKNGRVRKVHSVILLPGLESAELFSKKLEAIGNIHSDGRPILGLDCHDLLEIMLETCPEAIYIPAHIWTPHFSLFGAFSGFDTIEECFEDLTPHIHALETGLSSDPPMNWRLSALDGYQLISNSDAHSPAKLGREANLMDIELSYEGLSGAIQEGKGLAGTIEFFPEEGKYHYDGHRKCHLCLSPKEAEPYNGKCPVCGRKLTIGVSHRVEQLADREDGYQLENARPYESLVPLPEVIAASTGRSAASVKVQKDYMEMLQKLGSEFSILREAPIEDIKKEAGFLISEGINRLRKGEVERTPGYDGEYGKVKLIDDSELNALDGQVSLFASSELAQMPRKEKAAKQLPAAGKPEEPEAAQPPHPIMTESLNAEQLEAVITARRAIAVIAGPGTGKTKTLVSRILHLLNERRVKPTEITAVTFTNKAAAEMRERLEKELGKRAARQVNIGTFHSLCNKILKEHRESFTLADAFETLETAEETIRHFGLTLSAKQFLKEVSLLKTGLSRESNVLSEAAFDYYGQQLKALSVLDFDDLLTETLAMLESEDKNSIRKNHYSFLLVDEFQDISPIQYELIKSWNRDGRELFVIGDPDQSIYGFRGSDARCFERLSADYPELQTIRLVHNYRSTPEIVTSACQVINHNEGAQREIQPFQSKGTPLKLVSAPSELSEGIFVAREINRLIGGIDMLDTETADNRQDSQTMRSFSDIAVLYRTHRQAEMLETCLKKEGIPYVITGRDDFLTDRNVRGTVCFFRTLLDPKDQLSLRMCLKLLWDLPEETAEILINTSDQIDTSRCPYVYLKEKYLPKVKRTKPQKLLEDWAAELGLNENKSFAKFLDMTVFYKTLAEFMDTLTFGEEGDLKRSANKTYTSDAVTLMTLHGSKGLEFPIVFLYGAKKGMMPLEVGKLSSDIQEERRLFFVGMTRAKDELILTTSSEPSPFLNELPEAMLKRQSAGKPQNPNEGKQISLIDLLS